MIPRQKLAQAASGPLYIVCPATSLPTLQMRMGEQSGILGRLILILLKGYLSAMGHLVIPSPSLGDKMEAQRRKG